MREIADPHVIIAIVCIGGAVLTTLVVWAMGLETPPRLPPPSGADPYYPIFPPF